MNGKYVGLLAGKLLEHSQDAMAGAMKDRDDPDYDPMMTAALVFSGLGQALAEVGVAMVEEEEREREFRREEGERVRARVRGILREDG